MKRRNFMKKVTVGIGGVSLLGYPLIAKPFSKNSGLKVKLIEKDRMILVEDGKFWMGTRKSDVKKIAKKYGYHFSWISSEIKEKESYLPSYWIDKYPVTNGEYLKFCEATKHRTPLNWDNGKPLQSRLNHPVTMVNKADATAYAEWAGKSLPTEAQWEKAARGTNGQIFPWGNKFKKNACNWNRIGLNNETTTEVDAFPDGVSPYGVWDMCGNVMEWCADGPSKEVTAGNAINSYIKGGAWITASIFDLRVAAHGNSGSASNVSEFNGFRCIKKMEE